MSEKVLEKTLSATLRTEDFGSAGSRRLVRQGLIPAVIYGKDVIHVVLNAKEFTQKKQIFSESTLIEVNVEGKVHRCFVKTYQEDLLRGTIKHVDLFEVTAGHMVKTHVRIELTGTPVGCKVGGVLDQVMHEVEIECLPKNLPECLVADVSALELNESLRLADMKIDEKLYKVLSDMDAAVATCKAVKEEAEAEADAEADANAEPVVTTAKTTEA